MSKLMANQEHLMFTLDFHWMLFVCPLHDDYIPKRDGETAWTRLEQIMIMTKEEWDTDRRIPYEAEEDESDDEEEEEVGESDEEEEEEEVGESDEEEKDGAEGEVG